MAGEVWTILLSLALLLPARGLAQSGEGDDEDGDDAEPGVVCISELSFENSNLTCLFDHNLVGTHISLCWKRCRNSTLTRPMYTADITTVASYILYIEGKQEIKIIPTEIVKLPALKHITAIYIKNAELQIGNSYEYSHDFVKSFQFQAHIWNRTTHKDYESSYIPFIIEWEKLGGLKADSDYSVKMRVRPGDGNDHFFKGPWSAWSPTTNFTVDKEMLQNEKVNALLYSIIIAIIAILVLVICLVTRFHRKALKAFILPNVPHPKTTLVQMQKLNKGLLLSFSPDVFSDIHINRFDEQGEAKPLASEFTDGLETASAKNRYPSQPSKVLQGQVVPGDCTDSSDSAAGSQSSLEDEDAEVVDQEDGLEIWGTGLRLLGETDPSTSDSGHSSGNPSLIIPTCAPQQTSKDEAYVTMSSLFKKQ